MKPSELLADVYSQYGYCKDYDCLLRYINKDCIVAYKKEALGVIFVIRSARKYFGFIALRKGQFFLGGYDFRMTRLPISKAIELMGNEVIIENEFEMSRLRKIAILDNLEV